MYIIIYTMKQRTLQLEENIQQNLTTLGQQIRTARLQRKFTGVNFAKQVGISRMTLYAVERGLPTVAIGIYAAVLNALDGMDKELTRIVAKPNRKVQLNDWVERQYAIHKDMPADLRVAERVHKPRSEAESLALIIAAKKAWDNAVQSGWIVKTKNGYKLCEI